MLAKLNMSQYMKQFTSEQIDGDLFSECSDQILESELGISSRLHRLKLLRIIEGKNPIP